MAKNDLKIFAEEVAPEALHLIYELIKLPPFDGARVRIMPDVHFGTNCVVGFTSTVTNRVIPNVIGVDIGCGMLTVCLGKVDIDLPALDDFIKSRIPSGSAIRKTAAEEELIKTMSCCEKLRDMNRLVCSAGTLGGGNHFIEVDEDAYGNKYLIIHSGSRNLGVQVARIYQKLAIEICKTSAVGEAKKLAVRLVSEGRQEDIPSAVADVYKKHSQKTKTPADYCYLDGASLQAYLRDIRICQQFASRNRRRMADDILAFLRLRETDSFETVHNFIGDDGVIRKGAIPAHKGSRVLIPMNMRDGCIIGVGKGREDWNNSAPHGAGRLLSRGEAKRRLSVEGFKREMSGVYTTTANASTLDESPMAYKPAEEIVRLIAPTVDIVELIKPIYNFKAAE